MGDSGQQEIQTKLSTAATSVGLALTLSPRVPHPLEMATEGVYELAVGSKTIYILPGADGNGAPRRAQREEPGNATTRWLESLRATRSAATEGGALEEYLVARGAKGEQIFAYTLSPTGGGEPSEESAEGWVIAITVEERVRSEAAVDLLSGRALLDESILEQSSSMSWLLVRCERIGFTSPSEVEKLLGQKPRTPRFYEKSSTPVLREEALEALSEGAATRLGEAYPRLVEEGGEADREKGYLLLLYRITRGEATGALRSSRLVYAVPLKGVIPPRREGFQELVLKLLELQVSMDPEAGISWLRLLSPRRYQYLKPSPGSLYLYRTLFSLSAESIQRAFGELRRDRRAFRSLGQILSAAPRFDTAAIFGALSTRQIELLLPRHAPRMSAYAERLTTLLDSLRSIEEYAEEHPATAARPGMELFQKVARERFRRLRARVEASVSGGVYSLLFEHARLGWLQRAWSRLDRREMVRALAFEPPRVLERAGMLYSRRGRLYLREDADAVARRVREWDPAEILPILRARRRLWPILVDQLFDAESCERYVAALVDRMRQGGLPAAEVALTLLRLEDLRPGSVDAKTRIAAAARVAAEPALDEESESLLVVLSEDAGLLRQGGSRFAWLLAHALERMGRPEAAAEALELLLRQLAARAGELPPEEQRRVKRLGQKYKELTS